jgi:hypothetical protein
LTHKADSRIVRVWKKEFLSILINSIQSIGDILADFPVKAAKRLGRNSELYASHTKGQFVWVPGHAIGITLIYTMCLNVNTRSYGHLMGV